VNINLDRGYDSAKTRALLDEFGFTDEIARKGHRSKPANGGWSSVRIRG
jgi:hypothetical protein